MQKDKNILRLRIKKPMTTFPFIVPFCIIKFKSIRGHFLRPSQPGLLDMSADTKTKKSNFSFRILKIQFSQKFRKLVFVLWVFHILCIILKRWQPRLKI